jgi:uncharacterized membrane protein (DUF485 family)
MSAFSSPELQQLHRDQNRLRVRLAVVLLGALCLFALLLSWLGQDNPLRPLLLVKISLIGLLTVYAVGVGVAAIYARWIRDHRDQAVSAHQAASSPSSSSTEKAG